MNAGTFATLQGRIRQAFLDKYTGVERYINRVPAQRVIAGGDRPQHGVNNQEFLKWR